MTLTTLQTARSKARMMQQALYAEHCALYRDMQHLTQQLAVESSGVDVLPYEQLQSAITQFEQAIREVQGRVCEFNMRKRMVIKVLTDLGLLDTALIGTTPPPLPLLATNNAKRLTTKQ